MTAFPRNSIYISPGQCQTSFCPPYKNIECVCTWLVCLHPRSVSYWKCLEHHEEENQKTDQGLLSTSSLGGKPASVPTYWSVLQASTTKCVNVYQIELSLSVKILNISFLAFYLLNEDVICNNTYINTFKVVRLSNLYLTGKRTKKEIYTVMPQICFHEQACLIQRLMNVRNL